MKVINTYMVFRYGTWQVLFHVEGDLYFATTTGAFGQREMTIVQLTQEEGKNLMPKT